MSEPLIPSTVRMTEVDAPYEALRVALEDAQEQVTRLTAECAALALSRRALELRCHGLEERARTTHCSRQPCGSSPADSSLTEDASGTLGSAEDPSERIALARKALHDERERGHVILHCLCEGVLITDIAGRVEYLNPVAEALTGWPLEAAREKPFSQVLQLVGEDGAAVLPEPLTKCLAEDRPVGSGEACELYSRDGAVFAVDFSAAPIRISEGELVGGVITIRDVTETRRMAQQMAREAAHDPLTELTNRREFERRLRLAVSSANDRQATHVLAYMDLDNFKLVNDMAGHMAGDQVLRQLRTRIVPVVGDHDTFARLGGDEFGLLVENCTIDDGLRVGEAVLDALRAAPMVWEDRKFDVRASLGMVVIAAPSRDPSELLSRADIACFTAKRQGGDRVCLYDEGNDDTSRNHQEIGRVAVLRDALDRDRLRLYYQPIVPVSDPEVVAMEGLTGEVLAAALAEHPGPRPGGPGIEVLLRCLDANNQIIPPHVFIPAAERYGLMRTVDRWVIESVCRFCADMRAHQILAGDDLSKLAINLSVNSIADDTLPAFLRELFLRYDLPPQRFCFEITETCAVHNTNEAVAFVRELQSLGCTLALDDFGSGLSSFSYLKAMSVDYVKICGTFVRDMLENPIDYAVVSAIRDIAGMMGAETIAEHVHTPQLLRSLRELGVDYVQGDAIGAAQPLHLFASR